MLRAEPRDARPCVPAAWAAMLEAHLSLPLL